MGRRLRKRTTLTNPPQVASADQGKGEDDDTVEKHNDTAEKHEIINYLGHSGDDGDADFLALGADAAPSEGPSRLADRLGRPSKLHPEDQSAILSFPKGFLDSLSIGVAAASALKSQVQHSLQTQLKGQDEVALWAESLSSFEFDEKFARLVPSKASATISPRLADSILDQIESRAEFLPKTTFGLLLDKRMPSDCAHPQLVDRLLARKQPSLITEYIAKVVDLQEPSLFKIIEHILSVDEASLGSVKTFGEFGPRDCFLLHPLGCKVDGGAMKPLIKMLREEQVILMMTTLLKLMQLYSLVHADSFRIHHTVRSPLNTLPSKANVSKWVEIILDSHYPSLMHNAEMVSIVRSLNDLVRQDMATTDGLMGIKALTSAFAFLASKFPGSVEKPLPKKATCEEYSLEIVSF